MGRFDMAKAGRKRKSGKREKNGQLSRRKTDRQVRRSIEQADVMHVVRSARERVLGVAREASGTELGGTAVGRMYLRGMIGRRHLDVAKIIADRREAYSKAVGLGKSEPQAVDINAVHGRSLSEMSREIAEVHIEKWDQVVKSLDAVGRRGHLYAVVWSIVISDRDNVRDVDLLKIGLDAVADVVGLPLDIFAEAA